MTEAPLYEGVAQALAAARAHGWVGGFWYANWRKASTRLFVGARRLRAAKLAELEKLPVSVVKLTDAEAIEALARQANRGATPGP